MNNPASVDPRDRYHKFQSELVEAWSDAERMVKSFTEKYREKCADVIINNWVEPIAYCLMIRDRGFSIMDEESQFQRHQIPLSAQAVTLALGRRDLDKTQEGKDIWELFTVLHR